MYPGILVSMPCRNSQKSVLWYIYYSKSLYRGLWRSWCLQPCRPSDSRSTEGLGAPGSACFKFFPLCFNHSIFFIHLTQCRPSTFFLRSTCGFSCARVCSFFVVYFSVFFFNHHVLRQIGSAFEYSGAPGSACVPPRAPYTH